MRGIDRGRALPRAGRGKMAPGSSPLRIVEPFGAIHDAGAHRPDQCMPSTLWCLLSIRFRLMPVNAQERGLMQHQGTRADMARTAPPFGNEPRIAHAEGEQIAHWLRQAAEILQAQGANPFRVGAYRKAADTVESTSDVRALYETQGRAGLDALPGIGPAIAAALAEMLESGRWAQLERLRGALDPATLFHTVPGVGPQLAERIHDTLGIDTLEALEVACHDGRLRQVPGVGPRRIASIRAALAEILGTHA